jgi:hypothetical protein
LSMKKSVRLASSKWRREDAIGVKNFDFDND